MVSKIDLVLGVVAIAGVAAGGYFVYEKLKGFNFSDLIPKLPSLPSIPSLALPNLSDLQNEALAIANLTTGKGEVSRATPPASTKAQAQAAFNESVAPYLVSTEGIATATSNFEKYASYKEPATAAVLKNPQTPANYAAQVDALARRARVEMIQPSAGLVFFSGTQAQGYGQVLSGKKQI